MRIRQAYLLIVAAQVLVAVTLSPQISHATTIVGIRTPETVVIAADSKATFHGSGPEETRPVCKIFTLGTVGFAIGGMVKDASRGFDAEALVARAISRQPSLLHAVNDFEAELRNRLTRELNRQKQEAPDLLAKSIKHEYVTSVLLAAFEDDVPKAIALGFNAAKGSGGDITLTTSRLSCPGADCPSGTYNFYLGHRNPIDEYIRQHGKALGMSPEFAAQFFVELVIESGVAGVGPPVDVLVISKAGLSWQAQKSWCGGPPAGFQEKPYCEGPE